VEGEDFWKKPRMERWLFMFWVLAEERFRPAAGAAEEGGVAVGGEDDAAGGIVDGWDCQSERECI
jgi:hypothetical protein